MSFSNIEIKAKTNRQAYIRHILLEKGATFIGTDLQTDTYFNAPGGRLKLREGSIENALIFYERSNLAGPKQSVCRMMDISNGEALRDLLDRALGVAVVVMKKREIYYLGNVKFHLDELDGLGFFVEIEASDQDHPMPLERLREQCEYYCSAFLIKEEDLIDCSYSDMLLTRKYAPF